MALDNPGHFGMLTGLPCAKLLIRRVVSSIFLGRNEHHSSGDHLSIHFMLICDNYLAVCRGVMKRVLLRGSTAFI